MIEISVLLGLLTAHFVADFMLQSDRMAKNKSKSNVVLGQHVLVYSVVLYCFSLLLTMNIVGSLLFFGITLGTHFVTDFVTSRISAILYQQDKRHEFFCVIGLDQLIHAWTLILSWYWIFT